MERGLLNAIHKRSAGSPMFLTQIATSLDQRSPSPIRIDDEGIILLAEDIQSYDEILEGGAQSAILVRFDQLDVPFQNLLKLASVFGLVSGPFKFNFLKVLNVFQDCTILIME